MLWTQTNAFPKLLSGDGSEDDAVLLSQIFLLVPSWESVEVGGLCDVHHCRIQNIEHEAQHLKQILL